MTFTELVTAVIALTKRPDKQTATEQAVNAAISHFSLKTKSFKDLVEATWTADANLYAQSFDLTVKTTRFRSFKFIKQTGTLKYLLPVPHDKVFTPGGTPQKDCYYITGTTLYIITSRLASSIEVGYYQYPAILSGSNTHWLSDLAPQCIIDKAAARIFKDIGATDEARTHEAFATDAYNVLMNDFADSPYSIG